MIVPPLLLIEKQGGMDFHYCNRNYLAVIYGSSTVFLQGKKIRTCEDAGRGIM